MTDIMDALAQFKALPITKPFHTLYMASSLLAELLSTFEPSTEPLGPSAIKLIPSQYLERDTMIGLRGSENEVVIIHWEKKTNEDIRSAPDNRTDL